MSIGMSPDMRPQKMWTNETNIFHVVCIFVPEHTYLPWWFPSILIGAVEIDRNKHKSTQIHVITKSEKERDKSHSRDKDKSGWQLLVMCSIRNFCLLLWFLLGELFCVISCHFRFFLLFAKNNFRRPHLPLLTFWHSRCETSAALSRHILTSLLPFKFETALAPQSWTKN